MPIGIAADYVQERGARRGGGEGGGGRGGGGGGRGTVRRPCGGGVKRAAPGGLPPNAEAALAAIQTLEGWGLRLGATGEMTISPAITHEQYEKLGIMAAMAKREIDKERTQRHIVGQ